MHLDTLQPTQMDMKINYEKDTEQGKRPAERFFFQAIPLLPSEKQKDQQTSLHPVQSSMHHGQSSEHVEQ
jgi:hypothetical protein